MRMALPAIALLIMAASPALAELAKLAKLADYIPEGRDRPLHPSAIYGTLCSPSDTESPVYTQIALDAIYENESQFPYETGVIRVDEEGWLLYEMPAQGIYLPYGIHSPKEGIHILTLMPAYEDAPETQFAASIIEKKILLNGRETTIEVLDIFGVGSTDPSVEMGPPRKNESGGRPIHPLVFSTFISAGNDPIDPVLTQISLPAVWGNDNMFNDDFVKVDGNRVTYRAIEGEEAGYTREDLGDGIIRYNLSISISGNITRAAIDTRTIKRTLNYSEREYEVDVLDLVGITSEKTAALLAESSPGQAPPTPPTAPPPAPPAPPAPAATQVPAPVSPTLPAITPAKSRIRPSESIKLLTYANLAREKHDLGSIRWSDEIAAYAQGVADHLSGIFTSEREALRFKNRFQSREGADFPIDHGAPNPEPGFPAHSAFFYDRRPPETDLNLPPYGIIIEIHSTNDAIPPSELISSYPERYQWKAEKVVTSVSPATPLTQLLWRETRHIGCGVAEKADYHLTVFCFDPAGNIIGRTPF